MKKDKALIIKGIGIGMIITTLIFYSLIAFSTPKNTPITNSEIIQKAKSLGMIFLSELDAEKAIKEDLEETN